MFCRQIAWKPGQKTTTKNPISSYTLREGLAEGVTVTLVSGWEHSAYDVQDPDGKQWYVQRQCLVHEMEYEFTPGTWIHQSDPRLLPYFEKWKAEREARESRQREQIADGTLHLG